jgi:flagellar hook-associated protein 1 FlgK
MLNLATALQTARLSLHNAGAESALISRNIASAGQDGYNRRVADYVGEEPGVGVATTVRRIAEDALRNAALDADSRATAAATRQNALDALDNVAGTRGGTTTLPDLLGALRDSLTAYANDPGRATLGEAAVRSGQGVAARLNALADAAATLRQDADAGLADSVARVNGLLAKFKPANDAVVAAMATGRDASDALDARDALLADLSKEMGVHARPQRDGGLALYADGGLTLFEKTPRAVAFTPSGALPSGARGGAVTIDGVDATSGSSMMKLGAGRIAALIELRDQTGVALQAQFDETARGLIANFSEPGGPGLFVSAPGSTGAAALLRVNPAADPTLGGDATKLRDGAIAGVTMNPTGAIGFSDRLSALAASFDAPIAFGAAAGLQGRASLSAFAGQSLGWLAEHRRDAASALTQESAVRERTVQSLSNATGVNVDEEMARLLEIERAFQASAKILSAVDDMFNVFFQAVR